MTGRTTVGDPTLPSVPDYKDQPAVPSTSTTNNPADIWGLKNLYGQPVFLGVGTQLPQNDAGGFVAGRTALPDDLNQTMKPTQDVMKWATTLFDQQSAERKRNPGALTSYEALQQSLWQAGFYGQTTYDHVHVGQLTSQTTNALVSALGKYEQASTGAQSPITFSEFIGQNAQSSAQGGEDSPGGAGSGTSAASQVSVTDPNDIRAAAQQAAQDSLGYGLSATQLSSFVQSFQAKQTAAETSTAATVTSPDLTEDAVAYAQQQNPGAYQQHQSDAYQNALLDMMGLPTGSQRPNMTPVAAVTG